MYSQFQKGRDFKGRLKDGISVDSPAPMGIQKHIGSLVQLGRESIREECLRGRKWQVEWEARKQLPNHLK